MNVAFSSVFAPFDEISPAEYRRVDRGQLPRLCLRHAWPRWIGCSPGTTAPIVQVGSALAYRGIPLQSAYCGAKHAIQGFTRVAALRAAARHSPVRVTMVQMPAVNTPQFSWVLSRLPRRHSRCRPSTNRSWRPAAVLYAADHPRRREYWVGASTASTLVANAVAPGLLDRYLARTGYRSQQTQQPAGPDQSANLWQPVDQAVDYGAHGRSPPRHTTPIPRYGHPSTMGCSPLRPRSPGR